MQVRLAFSTAIQTDPDVLLVDEVLAVGDMEFQQKCFDVFNRFRKEGVTILFVSHDLGSVRRFCDRTLLLGGGEQRAFGDTGAILDRYIYGSKEEQGAIEEQPTKSNQEGQRVISRWGDNSIKITQVQFLDKFEGEGSKFSSFDPMTIRIYYHAALRVLDPVFGIALYAEGGQFLFGTNTEIKQIRIDHAEGNGYIDLKIDRITMLSGKFFLTVAVHAHDGKPYDWIDKQYSFDILPTGRDAGIFEVPCRWVT
jgi:lipopolysaccharide transport system ATP-binding protein